MTKKIKTLALILRSLPEEVQSLIYERLSPEVVAKVAALELDDQDQLSDEDWNAFLDSWSEFKEIIQNVRKEASKSTLSQLLVRERSKVREYLEYKQSARRDRPKLSSSIAKVIDRYIGV